MQQNKDLPGFRVYKNLPESIGQRTPGEEIISVRHRPDKLFMVYYRCFDKTFE